MVLRPAAPHKPEASPTASADASRNASETASWTSAFVALDHALGRVRLVAMAVLFAMLTACVAFSWFTRGAMAHLPFIGNTATRPSSDPSIVVDLHPWQIAQALSPLAVSREEVEFAHEAERLADHEVNQGFAAALRQAGVQHQTLNGEALELTQKVTQLQQTLKDDQARMRTANTGALTGDEDLRIAQAQVDLDTDELNDAQQDLARASGDMRSRIQQELAGHQAAVSKMNAEAGSDSQMAVLSTRQYGTLAGRIGGWLTQRSRYRLLQQAGDQARADAATLTAQHNALQARMDEAPANVTAVAPAKLATLQHKRAQRQLLSLYDDRIQTQQQLEGVYSRWGGQVMLQHQIVLHLIMRSLAMIACVLICVILGETVGTRLLERRNLERRRLQTLSTLLRLGVQLAGAVCVLFLLFGVPSQISTILGLATAGLTVALQSFILAFFGWFLLMGKSGMRVGDWVQINGVAGEVVEINLFRTTILETSDWAAKGHPTGRRATFINNFAVAGQFFNFSTTGQWMWDEMCINLPAGAETYDKIAAINQSILEETRQNAEFAEQEWKQVPRANSLSHTSAASSLQMRPAGTGVDVLIRYVARASERIELRNRLYERVLDVLHKRQAVIYSPQPSPLTAAVLAAGDSKEAKRHSMYT